MLIYNELPVPFPWYDNLRKQNRFRENCSAACDYKLITPKSNLLPFQFRRPKSGAILDSWKIMFLSNHEALDLTRNLSLIYAKTLEGNDYFCYNGEALQVDLEQGNTQVLEIPPGSYYSILTAANEVYYSEVFHVPETPFSSVESVKIPFLKLEWGHPSDLPPLYYNNASGFRAAYKNILYLDTIVTNGDFRIEEETIEDGFGQDIPVFQKLTIDYKFSVVVPDFIKLALAAACLHKKITITTPNGVRVGDVSRFNITSVTEADGCVSTIEGTFNQDLSLSTTECANNMEPEPCGPIVAPVIISAVTQVGGQLKLTGTAPTDSRLEVYAAATETGTYYKVHPGLPATDFIAGNAFLSSGQVGEFFWFKVVALNFNCNYGQSAPVLKT